ncbi:hypothetical protein Tsubulata_001614 [Turnera subulata]|uniref:Prolamin-like domain-containing protein n=1 Tax=Turnera subulata TaxID=218843 RepID=A0A9Q0EYM0_9ROSI|nr:hypothetical protein Tsubulata_001614 [Turnera subulata]
MFSDVKLFLVVALLACNLACQAKARPLISSTTPNLMISRLKLDGETSNCWESLSQLQACTGEIIVFFLNGETQLGHGCCQALTTIGLHCWPNMLGTLGFTPEESQILEGYCKKAEHEDVSTPSLPKGVVPNNFVLEHSFVP